MVTNDYEPSGALNVTSNIGSRIDQLQHSCGLRFPVCAICRQVSLVIMYAGWRSKPIRAVSWRQYISSARDLGMSCVCSYVEQPDTEE